MEKKYDEKEVIEIVKVINEFNGYRRIYEDSSRYYNWKTYARKFLKTSKKFREKIPKGVRTICIDKSKLDCLEKRARDSLKKHI